MDRLPCAQRTFPRKLAQRLPIRYGASLCWLRPLVERRGPEPALELRDEACREDDDPFLARILGGGWTPVPEGEAVDVQRACSPLFPSDLEGVTREKARELVERMPPLHQIRHRFPALN